MDPVSVFLIATAACEFWHQIKAPLLQFIQAMGAS